jgi:3-hydroxyacyl-[acyl-carrier-protein] dehydratase
MRFLLVDRIDALEPGRRIDAHKVVSFEEAWMPRPTAPCPALPPALLLEAVLQAGMWLLRASSDFARQPLVISAEGVRLGRPVRAGERVSLVAEIRQLGEDGAVLWGEARVGDEQVVLGERIVCAFQPLEQFDDPAEVRAAFEEMRRPKHERVLQR